MTTIQSFFTVTRKRKLSYSDDSSVDKDASDRSRLLLMDSAQRKAFRDMPARKGHVVLLNANSGSGKSTATLERVKVHEENTLFSCFNKSVQVDVEAKVKRSKLDATVKTLDSVVLGKCNEYFVNPGVKLEFGVNGLTSVVHQCFQTRWGMKNKKQKTRWDRFCISKDTTKQEEEEKEQDEEDSFKTLLDWVYDCVKSGDWFTFPTLHKIAQMEGMWSSIAREYEVIVIDEAQDLTACHIKGILQAREHCMLIFAGDSQQMLYAFLGAVDVFDSYIDTCRKCTFWSTYRFGQAVCDFVNSTPYGDTAKPLVANTTKHTSILYSGDTRTAQLLQQIAYTYLFRSNMEMLLVASTTRRCHVEGLEKVVSKAITETNELIVALQAEIRKCNTEQAALKDDFCHEIDRKKRSAEKELERLGLKLNKVQHYVTGIQRNRVSNKNVKDKVTFSTVHKYKGKEAPTVRVSSEVTSITKAEDFPIALVGLTRMQDRLVLDEPLHLLQHRYFNMRSG